VTPIGKESGEVGDTMNYCRKKDGRGFKGGHEKVVLCDANKPKRQPHQRKGAVEVSGGAKKAFWGPGSQRKMGTFLQRKGGTRGGWSKNGKGTNHFRIIDCTKKKKEMHCIGGVARDETRKHHPELYNGLQTCKTRKSSLQMGKKVTSTVKTAKGKVFKKCEYEVEKLMQHV